MADPKNPEGVVQSVVVDTGDSVKKYEELAQAQERVGTTAEFMADRWREVAGVSEQQARILEQHRRELEAARREREAYARAVAASYGDAVGMEAKRAEYAARNPGRVTTDRLAQERAEREAQQMAEAAAAAESRYASYARRVGEFRSLGQSVDQIIAERAAQLSAGVARIDADMAKERARIASQVGQVAATQAQVIGQATQSARQKLEQELEGLRTRVRQMDVILGARGGDAPTGENRKRLEGLRDQMVARGLEKKAALNALLAEEQQAAVAAKQVADSSAKGIAEGAAAQAAAVTQATTQTARAATAAFVGLDAEQQARVEILRKRITLMKQALVEDLVSLSQESASPKVMNKGMSTVAGAFQREMEKYIAQRQKMLDGWSRVPSNAGLVEAMEAELNALRGWAAAMKVGVDTGVVGTAKLKEGSEGAARAVREVATAASAATVAEKASGVAAGDAAAAQRNLALGLTSTQRAMEKATEAARRHADAEGEIEAGTKRTQRGMYGSMTGFNRFSFDMFRARMSAMSFVQAISPIAPATSGLALGLSAVSNVLMGRAFGMAAGVIGAIEATRMALTMLAEGMKRSEEAAQRMANMQRDLALAYRNVDQAARDFAAGLLTQSPQESWLVGQLKALTDAAATAQAELNALSQMDIFQQSGWTGGGWDIISGGWREREAKKQEQENKMLVARDTLKRAADMYFRVVEPTAQYDQMRKLEDAAQKLIDTLNDKGKGHKGDVWLNDQLRTFDRQADDAAERARRLGNEIKLLELKAKTGTKTNADVLAIEDLKVRRQAAINEEAFLRSQMELARREAPRINAADEAARHRDEIQKAQEDLNRLRDELSKKGLTQRERAYQDFLLNLRRIDADYGVMGKDASPEAALADRRLALRALADELRKEAVAVEKARSGRNVGLGKQDEDSIAIARIKDQERQTQEDEERSHLDVLGQIRAQADARRLVAQENFNSGAIASEAAFKAELATIDHDADVATAEEEKEYADRRVALANWVAGQIEEINRRAARRQWSEFEKYLREAGGYVDAAKRLQAIDAEYEKRMSAPGVTKEQQAKLSEDRHRARGAVINPITAEQRSFQNQMQVMRQQVGGANVATGTIDPGLDLALLAWKKFETDKTNISEEEKAKRMEVLHDAIRQEIQAVATVLAPAVQKALTGPMTANARYTAAYKKAYMERRALTLYERGDAKSLAEGQSRAADEAAAAEEQKTAAAKMETAQRLAAMATEWGIKAIGMAIENPGMAAAYAAAAVAAGVAARRMGAEARALEQSRGFTADESDTLADLKGKNGSSGSSGNRETVKRETVYVLYVADPVETPAEAAQRLARRFKLVKELDMQRRSDA